METNKQKTVQIGGRKKSGLECEIANHSTKSGNFYGLIFGCPKHLIALENAIESALGEDQ